MRMINADALARRIKALKCRIASPAAGYVDEDSYECGAVDALSDALRYISEAPAVGGWISVKDRLPETQNPVIVCVPPHKGGECETYIGYVGMAYYTYSGKGGWWCGTDGALYGAIGGIPTPTHWMQLPEPPEQ